MPLIVMDKDIKYKKNDGIFSSVRQLLRLSVALSSLICSIGMDCFPKIDNLCFFSFLFFSSRQVHKQPFPAFYSCHHVKKEIQKIFNLSIFNVSPYRAFYLEGQKSTLSSLLKYCSVFSWKMECQIYCKFFESQKCSVLSLLSSGHLNFDLFHRIVNTFSPLFLNAAASCFQVERSSLRVRIGD